MNFIHLPETASTNTHLKEISASCDIHGTVVYTWNQLSGYGRHGRYWHSDGAKNIAVSVGLKPSPDAEFAPMSIVAGFAVAQAISAFTKLDAGLKWPNDVMVDGGKVCGISCERISTRFGPRFVIGIGINVNNSQFPNELTAIATSLLLKSGQKWDAELLLSDVVNSMFVSYERLCTEGFAPILADYKRLCVNLGRVCVVLSGDRRVSGIVTDIDDTGCIILQKECGATEIFASGEVSLRSADGGFYATGC